MYIKNNLETSGKLYRKFSFLHPVNGNWPSSVKVAKFIIIQGDSGGVTATYGAHF
jgi:hypothetical protein